MNPVSATWGRIIAYMQLGSRMRKFLYTLEL
jgi:hypothetical protein